MKEIKLTQGQVALVDDEDYDFLMQWKWYAVPARNTFYAKRSAGPANGRYYVRMHRLIMNTPKHMEVDHIDHNGLNNQKYNLRNCTRKENSHNRISTGKVPFLGVSITSGLIIAQIGTDGRNMRIGYFKTFEEPAMAYDLKAKELFGEFANTNFKHVTKTQQ